MEHGRKRQRRRSESKIIFSVPLRQEGTIYRAPTEEIEHRRCQKGAEIEVFLSLCLKRFDTSTFLLYTLCFVRGLFTQAVVGHVVVSRVVGRIFTPGTLHDGLGVRSGRIWDASPAKPSKPLQVDAKSGVLPLGVCAELLAGLSGFAVHL